MAYKDDFQGNDIIRVQPSDTKVPYCFTFTYASACDGDDGALPHGTTIQDYDLTAHKSDGTDATSELIHSHSRSNNVVTVNLKYPTSLGTGWYHLVFVLTLDTGTVVEFDFNRVEVKDV